MKRIGALTVVLVFLGCTERRVEDPTTDAERMAAIVVDAQRRATDSEHRDLLSRGSVFVDLEGLDIPCVGVSVPINNNANRIHVSFTKDWFHTHSDDEIADAVLDDLQRALSDSASR